MAALSAASIFTSNTLSSTFLPPTSLSVSATRFSSARGKILNVILSYGKKVLSNACFLSLLVKNILHMNVFSLYSYGKHHCMVCLYFLLHDKVPRIQFSFLQYYVKAYYCKFLRSLSLSHSYG